MGVGASIAYLIALDDDRLMFAPRGPCVAVLLFVIPEKMSGDTVWTVGWFCWRDTVGVST